jgi:hypothetical protein
VTNNRNQKQIGESTFIKTERRILAAFLSAERHHAAVA